MPDTTVRKHKKSEWRHAPGRIVSARIPDQDYDDLARYAGAHGVTVGEFVRAMITTFSQKYIRPTHDRAA